MVGVDAQLGIGLVILGLKLKANGPAQGVDLIHSDLGAVHGSLAVDGVFTGRADTAQRESAAGSASGLAALVVVLDGLALLGALAGFAGSGGAAGAGAAGQQAQAHGPRHEHGHKILLFHSGFLLY